MKDKEKTVLICGLTFVVCFAVVPYVFGWIESALPGWFDRADWEAYYLLFFHLLTLPPLIAGALWLGGQQRLCYTLGLEGNLREGLKPFGVLLLTMIIILLIAICIQPMFILLPVALYECAEPIIVSLVTVLIRCVLFTGFTFAQLYRRADWGYAPAVLFVSGLYLPARCWRLPFQHFEWEWLSSIFVNFGLIIVFDIVWAAWFYTQWRFNIWALFAVQWVMHIPESMSPSPIDTSDELLMLFLYKLFIAVVVSIYTVIYRRRKGYTITREAVVDNKNTTI